MKLGPVAKLDKKTPATSKNVDAWSVTPKSLTQLSYYCFE